MRKTLPASLVARLEELRYIGLPDPFRVVRAHTLLSNLNLFFLHELVRRLEAEKILGDFVECGVFRGGSAGVLGHGAIHSSTPRRLRLFDAFAGMPKASSEDDAYSHTIEGDFVGSEEQTRRILKRLGVSEEQFELNVGWFEQTLPLAEKRGIALLHVDCDLYDPVLLTLQTFYPLVADGGYVVLNDYGSFQGCRVATHEYLESVGASKLVPLQIDQDAYYFQKPATRK